MINKKAQTLTELATFGSVLLLVLSFFVSYGMRYNYDQDAQMRAFRMAMADAYNNSRPDASGSLFLVEDKHIPDPRDTFGIGNIVPVQAGAGVTWGNTLEEKYVDGTDLPRMKFKINGKPVKHKVNDKKYDDYTTAGYSFIFKTDPTTKDGFYVKFPGEKLRVKVKWEDVYIYKPDSTDKNPPTQIKVLLKHNLSTDKDDETEMISEVSESPTGSMKQIIRVAPYGGKDGDAVTQLYLLDSSAGEINPNYLNLGGDTGNVDDKGEPIYVTPATLQGLLPEDMVIRRNDSLTITQTPGVSNTVTSTNIPDFTAVITHKIKSNSGEASDEFPYTVSYKTKKWRPAAWEIKMKE